MLLTLHQVAEQLQVHWSTVRQAGARGELRVVKLGKTAKSWRVDPADLADYLSRNKTPCPSEAPKKTAPTWSRPTPAVATLDELLRPSRKRRALSKS